MWLIPKPNINWCLLPVLSARYCNVYGIDMPTRTELVAYNRSVPEIARTIGADRVIYLSLKDLVGSVLSCAAPGCAVSRFDTSVFDGVWLSELFSRKTGSAR
jgi:amidophosphoribosyltransferase